MATLPRFEQLGLREPSPQLGAVSYQPSSGLEEAPSQAAAKFGETVQQIAFQQQESLNTTRAEDAWNQYKNTAMDLSIGNGGFATQRGGAAVNGNLFPAYTGKLAAARKEIEKTLGDDDVRRRFSDRANVTDLQFKDQLLRHYTSERDAYEKQTFDGTVAAATSMVSNSPLDQGVFDTALLNTTRRAEALARHQGITDKDSIDKIKNTVRDTLIVKRLDTLVYSNPIAADQLFRMTQDQITNPETRLLMQHKIGEAALGVSATIEADNLIVEARGKLKKPSAPAAAPRAGAPLEVGFEGAVESLLKREGGYNPSDGKSKAPVNFGINQKANPDIDVAKLTKEQAKAIYKTRYWDAIGGDTLPPATAMVALDAAALQGTTAAKSLLLATDGDPQAMIDLRRQQLTALAERDPEQKPNLAGWMKRLDGLQAQIQGMQRVAYHPDDPTAQDTSGLPNSRDLATMLPMMTGRVEERATELYGADPGNPDRAAFVRRTTSELRAKVSADVQQLATIQRQSQGILIDAIIGGRAAGPAPAGAQQAAFGQVPATNIVTSFAQVQADPNLMRAWQTLDPGVKPALLNLIDKNRDDKPGDVVLFRDLFNRIHLEPGDPKKIDFYKQIVDPQIVDRLSMPQINALRSEIDRNETPGGRSLNQMRKAADSNVALFFRTTPMFTAQPDRQIAATMRWNEEVGKKIDDYVKAGTPDKVRQMFMADGPESVVSQKYLQTFIDSTPAQGLAAQAAQAKAPAQPKNEAEYNALPPGSVYLDPNGKQRQKPGQAPAAAAPPAAGAAAVAQPQAMGARADGTPKGAGYFGPQPTTTAGAPTDQISTEISVGVNIGGKDREIPTMVPTLTKPELDYLLAGGDPRKNEAIMTKAIDHAKQRIEAGKDPFAQPGEQVAPPGEAPAAQAAEQPVTADDFELVEKPTTVAGALVAIRKARARALEIRKMGAQGPQFDPLGPVESLGAGVKVAASRALAVQAAVGEAIQRPIPTELEAISNGFDAIKKTRKVALADQDILEQVLKYGLLKPEDEKLARGLLDRINKKAGTKG